MLEDAFITSFCTGPIKVPACGCLISNRPSDFFESNQIPPAIFIFWARNIQMYINVHHIILHWACRCPKKTSMHVVVCFPTGRLIMRERLPKVCSDALGSNPRAVFIVLARNIQMSVNVHNIILHWACRCPKQRSCMWLFAFPQAV